MERKSTHPSGCRYQFRLNNVPADADLESEANLHLAQCLALAPPASKAVGILEKEDRFFVCAIEVSSAYRSFFEKASGLTPRSAVKRALDKIENRLYHWRYGGGSTGSSLAKPLGYNQTQTQC